MKHLGVLIIHDGDTGINRLHKAIDYVCNQLEVSDNDQKNLKELITEEDIIAFQKSHQLSQNSDKIGYVIVIGKNAYEKIQEQIKNKEIVIYSLGPTSTWDNKLIRDKIAQQINDFVSDFINYKVEKKIVVAGDKIKNTKTIDTQWISCNIEDVKRFLKLELDKDRWHALIYDRNNTKTKVKLIDATTKQREEINDLTPILVQDLEKQENIKKILEKNNFKNVVLLELNEFIKILEIICSIDVSKKTRLEISYNE